MTTNTPSSQPLDNDLLRQREIAAQVAALRAPPANVRAAAARRLGEMKAGLDQLLSALNDPHETVRTAAAMALGVFTGDPRLPVIVDDLLSTIDDPSERVCQAAIRSLGMLRARVAQAEIEDFLEEANPHIAGSAILALARIGADCEPERETLGRRLADFLGHPSSYVRMQAVRAMGLLQYHPAGPRLVEMLYQTRALRQASRQEAQPAADEYPGVQATRPRDDENYTLLNQLVRVTGELRLSEAMPVLLDIAQKDIGLRGLAVESLIANGASIDPDLLFRLLRDPSVVLRRRLILWMANQNYRLALPLLRGLLGDESVSIRAAVLQALTRLEDRESLAEVEWMAFHDHNPFLRLQATHSLAALLGPRALGYMLALSSDPNQEVRRASVSHLLQWKSTEPAVLAALARFLQDNPEDENGPAISALIRQHPVSNAAAGPAASGPAAEGPAADGPAAGFAASGLPAGLLGPAATATLFPPALQADSGQLLELLRAWRLALQENEQGAPGHSYAAQRALTALRHLITLIEQAQGE